MDAASGPVARLTSWRLGVRVAAALVPLATCALLATVRGSVTGETAVLVLVLWVVAAAGTGDRVAAVLAAVSGGAWFDFFLTQPYLTFTIDDSDDVEAMVLLVLISLAVTEVALWGRRQQAASARQSGYLDGVVGVAASAVEGAASTTAVIDLVEREMTKVLGVDRCRYVAGPVHDRRVALLDHDGELTRDGRPVDVARSGMPVDEYVAVPVRRSGTDLGHFLVTSTSRVVRPSREQRRVAVLLADQVAVAVSGPD
jgi:K+-sensing histidine kinase KdpD